MVGLLFLPYTAMVLAYTVMGSMMAPRIHWDRVLAIVVIYFLGLGIAAHALDALGGEGGKPWGEAFSAARLRLAAGLSLAAAYGIAAYYMVHGAPWLLVVALLEGFFVFAYNLEWFGGTFHTDRWFAFSWGFLPVLAGYIIQTNRISPVSVLLALSMALFSMVEIKASRPYKALKKRLETLDESDMALMKRYETMLKSISLGVIFLGAGLMCWRLMS